MTHKNRKQLDYTTPVLELRLGLARNVTSDLAVCSVVDDNHLEDALAQFLNDDPNEQLWVKVSERTLFLGFNDQAPPMLCLCTSPGLTHRNRF
jgi:hypothetical protein